MLIIPAAGVPAGSLVRSQVSSALLQTQRVTTGSIAGAASASVTVTWATAFPDANYTISANVLEATAGTSTLRVHHIVSQSETQCVIRVVNDDAVGAHTGTLHVTAVHD